MSKIAEFIKSQERKNFPFVPNRDFYDSVGINKKRWALLFKNKKPANIDELSRLASFFGIKVNDLIDSESSKVS